MSKHGQTVHRAMNAVRHFLAGRDAQPPGDARRGRRYFAEGDVRNYGKSGLATGRQQTERGRRSLRFMPRLPALRGFAEKGKAIPCAFCGQAREAISGFARTVLSRLRAVPGAAVAAARAKSGRWRERESVEPGLIRTRTFRPRSYPGSRARRYDIYVPVRCNGRNASPLVMVLHGCQQTHADICAISAFNALAEREGFVALYPFVTNYADFRINNCWGWWREEEISPGAGEVEDLWQIVEEVRQEVRIDPGRIHVAGLSSGGGMAVAAMVAHCHKIASGAVVAGVPYAETARAVAGTHVARGTFRPVSDISIQMNETMGDNKRLAPILIVHSRDDPVVELQSAENLRESWADCFGIKTSNRVSVRSGATLGTAWEHKKYYGFRWRSAIETFYLEGVGHGWYGGAPGRFSYPDAPNVTEYIWEFLRRHPL